jgi:hypothetical protein
MTIARPDASGARTFFIDRDRFVAAVAVRTYRSGHDRDFNDAGMRREVAFHFAKPCARVAGSGASG